MRPPRLPTPNTTKTIPLQQTQKENTMTKLQTTLLTILSIALITVGIAKISITASLIFLGLLIGFTTIATTQAKK